MVQWTLRKLLLAALSAIIGAVVTGYFFAVGEDLWQGTKEGMPTLPNLWNPFWFVSVPLAIIGILLLIYDVLGKHKHIPRVENVSAPSQKGASWFSKFRRPPIWEGEQRIRFWTTIIFIEIFGAIGIHIFLDLFFFCITIISSNF